MSHECCPFPLRQSKMRQNNKFNKTRARHFMTQPTNMRPKTIREQKRHCKTSTKRQNAFKQPTSKLLTSCQDCADPHRIWIEQSDCMQLLLGSGLVSDCLLTPSSSEDLFWRGTQNKVTVRLWLRFSGEYLRQTSIGARGAALSHFLRVWTDSRAFSQRRNTVNGTATIINNGTSDDRRQVALNAIVTGKRLQRRNRRTICKSAHFKHALLKLFVLSYRMRFNNMLLRSRNNASNNVSPLH